MCFVARGAKRPHVGCERIFQLRVSEACDAGKSFLLTSIQLTGHCFLHSAFSSKSSTVVHFFRLHRAFAASHGSGTLDPEVSTSKQAL